MHTIAFTGHRPQDLPADMTYLTFEAALDALRVGERDDIRFVVGGALGTDTWAATYAGLHDIPFHLVLPFEQEVMKQRWRDHDRVVFDTNANLAERITVLSSGPYAGRNYLYQQRNVAMVDEADHVFALWSGKDHGGTTNCIRYALQAGKPVYNLWPLDGRLRKVSAL